jgi:hypothetical protein
VLHAGHISVYAIFVWILERRALGIPRRVVDGNIKMDIKFSIPCIIIQLLLFKSVNCCNFYKIAVVLIKLCEFVGLNCNNQYGS